MNLFSDKNATIFYTKISCNKAPPDMPKWLECSPSVRKVAGLNPSRVRPKT